MTESRTDLDQVVADLHARLDAVEQAALAAKEALEQHAAAHDDPDDPWDYARSWRGFGRSAWTENAGAAISGHIIRHDPDRVLRQVAAHRAILDECERVNDGTELGVGVSPEQWLAQTVIRHLASAYAEADSNDESERAA